ncbi:MAG: molybdopterin molybdenumtransferase MoeA [Desulfobacteraceae bacterium]|nr:MAG: molybdopterin molybdenumtransferase MoeA [Desulfobacteraceae bacterium]
MKDFFKVTELGDVLKLATGFKKTPDETIPIQQAPDRILAEDIIADRDLPGFDRSVMDGYALAAAATFGASEANPALLHLTGSVRMGEPADGSVGRGEAVKVATGGMIPEGADSVAMVEHTQLVDPETLEVFRSLAPGSNMIRKGEDFPEGAAILSRGCLLRSQEIGLLAAFGRASVRVCRKPVVGIVSTGDEIVPIHQEPGPAQIRDINTYSMSALVSQSGGIPVSYGIIRDRYEDLLATCLRAVEASDMIIISGGSSVGTRDYTIDAISALPESEILVHGISISPGKPTILGRSSQKPVWGLPGHVVSSMIVFHMVVKPFLEHIRGRTDQNGKHRNVSAFLSRNVSSAQGRVDCVRVRLMEKDGRLLAEPILGKSALINTMVKADGLVVIGLNSEGLEKNTLVSVIPI